MSAEKHGPEFADALEAESAFSGDGLVGRPVEATLSTLDVEARDREGGVLSGRRYDYRGLSKQMVEVAGEQVREGLSAPEVVADFVASVKEGVRKRSRTEMNLYAQIMKLVGEERRIVVEFVQGLGVRSEADLKRMVEMAKSVEGVGPHDGAERCVAYLEAYFNAYPEQRGAALKRLGGYVPV